MKKIAKHSIKHLLIVMLLCTSWLFFSPIVSQAEYSELYQELERSTIDYSNTVKYSQIIANTKTTRPEGNVGGLYTVGSIEVGKWYKQSINLFEVGRGQNTLVVPWSVQTGTEWKFMSVAAMAKDFESKNPGWIVLGGINGDFYDWHTTLDYPNSGLGSESVFGNNLRIALDRDAVAIQNDSSTNQLVFMNSGEFGRSEQFSLTVYDQNDHIIYKEMLDNKSTGLFGSYTIVYEYDVHNNPVLNQYDEHKIASRDYKYPVVPNGTLYQVKADKVIQQSGDGSFYGIGKIDLVKTAQSSDKIEADHFGLVTTDSTLSSLLGTNVKIRLQKEYTGVNGSTEFVMGAHHVLVEDGTFSRYYTSESYYTTRAPRTILAQKADGTIGLITIDGRQPSKDMYGANQEEMNAVLESFGYTDAILLDGGGSTTLAIRKDDEIVVVNSPSDGSTRQVSNGLLIVAPIPNFTVQKGISTRDSITFSLTNNDPDITSVIVSVNGVEKVINDTVTFSGLEPNSSYPYTIYYIDSYQERYEYPLLGMNSTAKIVPTIKQVDITYDERYVYISPVIEDPENSFIRYFLDIGEFSVNSSVQTNTFRVNLIYAPKHDLKYTLRVSYNINNNQGDVVLTYQEQFNLILGRDYKEPDVDIPIEEPKKGCFGGVVISGAFLILPFGAIILKKKDN